MTDILVTGAAGFIGMHTCERLLNEGYHVAGVDNFSTYYSRALKEARIARLRGFSNFNFLTLDLKDRTSVDSLAKQTKPRVIIHLAAQAGVRYSLDHPHAYVDANLVGFLNVLEAARQLAVDHFIYASSSSVYGGNTKVPFEESDPVDDPVSLYAATKRSNELMAHTYSHLYGLQTTGLRFFTVYGPWGRPDMSPILFADAIWDEKPLNVYNYGDMQRDFTYIDDVVESVYRVFSKPPAESAQYSTPDAGSTRTSAAFRLFNVGNSSPILLKDYIAALAAVLGKKAVLHHMPMQPGDVYATYADTSRLKAWTGFAPQTDLSVGLKRFSHWYLNVYQDFR